VSDRRTKGRSLIGLDVLMGYELQMQAHPHEIWSSNACRTWSGIIPGNSPKEHALHASKACAGTPTTYQAITEVQVNQKLIREYCAEAVCFVR